MWLVRKVGDVCVRRVLRVSRVGALVALAWAVMADRQEDSAHVQTPE